MLMLFLTITAVCACIHEITAVVYKVRMSNCFNGKSPVTEHMKSTIYEVSYLNIQ